MSIHHHVREEGEIDGSKIVHEFLILREGWEMDNYGWVTEDGRIWETSHGGRPYRVTPAQLDEKIEETQESLDGMRLAIGYQRLLSKMRYMK